MNLNNLYKLNLNKLYNIDGVMETCISNGELYCNELELCQHEFVLFNTLMILYIWNFTTTEIFRYQTTNIYDKIYIIFVSYSLANFEIFVILFTLFCYCFLLMLCQMLYVAKYIFHVGNCILQYVNLKHLYC